MYKRQAPVLPGLPGGAMDETREMSMNAMIPKILSQELDNIIERTNMKFKNRKMIRNCAVDGDGCFYILSLIHILTFDLGLSPVLHSSCFYLPEVLMYTEASKRELELRGYDNIVEEIAQGWYLLAYPE